MPRSRCEVYSHLVGSTWDRMRLLTADLEANIHACILAAAEALGCAPIAVGGIEDHVHLLARLGATVAQFAKQIKGSSAHLVSQGLDGQEFFRWQGRYGAFSVSPDHLPAVTA